MDLIRGAYAGEYPARVRRCWYVATSYEPNAHALR